MMTVVNSLPMIMLRKGNTTKSATLEALTHFNSILIKRNLLNKHKKNLYKWQLQINFNQPPIEINF
jgi:hypothetical protein